MVNTIEEFRDVQIDQDQASRRQVLRHLGNGRMRAPPRPEAVAAGMEVGLEGRLQDLEQGLLHHPIPDVGDAERPLPDS